MKKLILLFFIALGSIVSTQAQILPTFKLGVKGGLNFTKLTSEDKVFNSDNAAGFLAGIWGRVGIAGFHVQPELYYTTKNAHLKTSGADSDEADVKFSNIDLPILLGTKFGLGPIGARVQVGPIFSFVVDKNESNLPVAVDDFKDSMTGLVGGLGVDIKKISVDLRYEYGLTNISTSSTDKQRLNLWTIGIGYSFF